MRHHDDARRGNKLHQANRHRPSDAVTVEVEAGGVTYRVPAHRAARFKERMKDAERGHQRAAKGHSDGRQAKSSGMGNQWSPAANAYRYEDKR